MLNDKFTQGEDTPIEWRYMMQEPRTYKTYIDFLIMYRWVWALQVTIIVALWFFVGWLAMLVGFAATQALWYFYYRFFFKRLEAQINEYKTKFTELKDRIIGY